MGKDARIEDEIIYRNQRTGLSRRDFFKGVATAGVAVAAATTAGGALAGCAPQPAGTGGGAGGGAVGAGDTLTADIMDLKWSFEIPAEPVADSDIAETITHDVVVIGAGLSGLCTAVSAQEQGADVRLFSASTRPISRGGSNSALGSSYQKSLGINIDANSPELDHLFKVENVSGAYQQNQQMWAKWRNHSGESMDWMIDIMAAKGLKVSMEPGYWDPDGILDSPPASHNFFTDEQPFGALFGAPLQAKAYADTFIERGGSIDFETRALYLIRGGKPNGTSGRVEAVVAQRADGSYVKYEAKKAIVMATGDFSINKDMMAKYAPWTYGVYKDVLSWSMQDSPNYDIELNYSGLLPGDGHKMGLWVGAAWQKNNVSPMINVGVPGPGYNAIDNCWCINLNSDGKRFQRETVNFGHGGVALLNQKDHFAFSVWQQDYAYIKDEWETFGVNVGRENGIMPADPAGMIAQWDRAATPPDPNAEPGPFGPPGPQSSFKADTIDDLLKQVNEFHPINIEAAKKSIEDYDRYAKQGNDDEFHVKPEVLHPISTPPFYASCATPGGQATFLTVCGGLRTNADMQVCTEDDTPIEGLYNTGIMTGDFYSTTYNFVVFGQNLGGVCCTLSYLLGRDLAKL
ncbi:MAG: FAD-dependent oxidoreductase [Coriobacteriales bacterium]|jgi:hypothetical protein|nr:FAD-dependent oxidoreductase [Coriobacteriales bacterium]